MKIMVIGAHGQLGRDLISRIGSPFSEVLSLDLAQVDITDREAVLKVVENESPQMIVNCAAYTQVDKAEEESELAFKVNGEGAANIAEAALACKTPLIHISTDFVFDGEKSEPYTESDEPAPLSVYGKSKLKGDDYILDSGCDAIIIRTSWLYSVHGNNFVDTILHHAKEKEVLKVVDDQFGSPTWTWDLAGVILHIAAQKATGNKKSGIYNYTNRGAISWYEFAEAIIDEARKMGEELKCTRIEPIPTSEYPTLAERPKYSVLSTKRFEEDFDFPIEPWRGSLRKMMKQLHGELDA